MRFKIVLCLLVLLLLMPSVSATNTTESFSFTSTNSGSFEVPGTTNILPVVNRVTFGDAQTMKGIKYVTWTVPSSRWHASNPSASSLYEDVTFSTYGTGQFGYTKVGTNYIMLISFNSDFDISALSGVVHIPMTGMSTYYCAEAAGVGHSSLVPSGNTVVAVGGTESDVLYNTWTNTHYYYTSYIFNNTYTYDIVNYVPTMWIDKNGYSSKFNITGIYTESAFASTDKVIKSNQTVWVLDVTDSFGAGYSDTVYFIMESIGTITLNQSSYTEPELIQIDAELTTYEFVGHSYKVELERLTDDGSYVQVTNILYNDTTTMTNTTKSIYGDINFYSYEIPLKIRVVLKDYNKGTGVTTTIAISDTVLYNPPSGAEFLVTGTVVNAMTNEVLPGAIVTVTGPTYQFDNTDDDGRFYLYLAAGTYTFTTEKTGYETNVDDGIIISSDTSGIKIPLVQTSTDNGEVYGSIRDADTKTPLSAVHVILTNATDMLDGYSDSNGYYLIDGVTNNSTYTIRGLKRGYYTYNSTVTTDASASAYKSFNMTSETSIIATAVPTVTYPGGSGQAWSNDEIVNWLRVNVMSVFILVFFLILAAFMMSFGGGSGGMNQREKYGPGIWGFNRRKRW